MIVNEQLAKSRGHILKDLWETPIDLFIQLDSEFKFTLDPCCEEHTARCTKFYTYEQNGLVQDWEGETVFCNPPYSRGNIDVWMYKCFKESLKPRTKVVALVPVSTSSKWFHEFVLGKSDIRYIKGRVRFRGAPYTAPFSSMIIIWK
jgi:phage N-6-adenine-methyltransferase